MDINFPIAVAFVESQQDLTPQVINMVFPNPEQKELRDAIYLFFKEQVEPNADALAGGEILLLVAAVNAVVYNDDLEAAYFVSLYWQAEKHNGHGSPLLNQAKEAMVRLVAKTVIARGGKNYVFRDPNANYDDPYKYLIQSEYKNVIAGQHVSAVFVKQALLDGLAVFDQSRSAYPFVNYDVLIKVLDPRGFNDLMAVTMEAIYDNSRTLVKGVGMLEMIYFYKARQLARLDDWVKALGWLYKRDHTKWFDRGRIRKDVAKQLRRSNPMNDPLVYSRAENRTRVQDRRELVRTTGIPGKMTISDYTTKDFKKIPDWAKEEYVTVISSPNIYPILSELDYDAEWWSSQPALPAPFNINPYPDLNVASIKLDGFGERERMRRKRLRKAGLTPQTAEQIYAGLVLHSVMHDALD